MLWLLVLSKSSLSEAKILLPLVTGPLLEPSQLPWEYTACAAKYVAHQAKSITRTISALTGTYVLLGEEKQLLVSVLLRDTSVMNGIRPHILMN